MQQYENEETLYVHKQIAGGYLGKSKPLGVAEHPETAMYIFYSFMDRLGCFILCIFVCK